jgi:hypothetical protein
MRPRRKTGVVGKAHAPDRDLELPREPDRQDVAGTSGDRTGFGEDFWEGQRPPHW